MNIFVWKEEEALKFEEDIGRYFYRKEHDIPDTGGLLEIQEEWEKRKRSEAFFIVSLDKPGQEKNLSRYYTRVIMFWILVARINAKFNIVFRFKTGMRLGTATFTRPLQVPHFGKRSNACPLVLSIQSSEA